ncbi:hypothetical protein QTP86_010414 [Hemibagrus guttatus]|nr:hypothetical protein QTP86_010414 [Hemibagrus guttatus]
MSCWSEESESLSFSLCDLLHKQHHTLTLGPDRITSRLACDLQNPAASLVWVFRTDAKRRATGQFPARPPEESSVTGKILSYKSLLTRNSRFVPQVTPPVWVYYWNGCVYIGNVVGHDNIVSASRMNSAIVVFLNDVDKVRKLTQNGIVAIGKELSRYGGTVSPIKKIPLGCMSPLVKHLVSFRRMVFMVFKEGVATGAGRGRAGRGRSPCGREGPGAAAAPDLTESEPQVQPAAQKPTGAAPAPEKPRSAPPDRKKPWSTEKSSAGSGAVLEPPALTEAGTEVQGNRMETPGTTPVQGDGGDVDMVDEPVFKVPNKRKKQGKGQGKKQARKETKVEERESDSDDCISDSVLTFHSQEEQINVVYSAEDIKEFLRNTKWQKNVTLEEFFPDRKQFIHDVKFFRREGAFVDVEIFRLKKLITRVNRENSDDE